MFFLLVCIGLLADNRYNVSAMRHREFFLKETQAEKAGVQTEEFLSSGASVFNSNTPLKIKKCSIKTDAFSRKLTKIKSKLRRHKNERIRQKTHSNQARDV
jgi:hypothetical protein